MAYNDYSAGQRFELVKAALQGGVNPSIIPSLLEYIKTGDETKMDASSALKELTQKNEELDKKKADAFASYKEKKEEYEATIKRLKSAVQILQEAREEVQNQILDIAFEFHTQFLEAVKGLDKAFVTASEKCQGGIHYTDLVKAWGEKPNNKGVYVNFNGEIKWVKGIYKTDDNRMMLDCDGYIANIRNIMPQAESALAKISGIPEYVFARARKNGYDIKLVWNGANFI